MGKKVSLPKYEIKAEVGGRSFTDINIFYFYRLPWINSSAYSKIVMHMPVQYFLELNEKIRNNEFPMFTITIDVADESKKKGDNLRSDSTTYLATVRQLIAIKSGTSNVHKPSEQIIPCTFLLVDKILHRMGQEASFNYVLNNKTAKQAIGSYEGHISERYGGQTFDFKTIGSNYNEYIYEEQLIKGINNLVIPSELIMNHKPTFTPSYYFIDTFRNTMDVKRTLCCLFVDIGNKDLFEKFDIYENGREEIQVGTTLVKETPILDKSNYFKKDSPTVYIKDRNNNWKYYIPDPPVSVDQQEGQFVESKLDESCEKGRGGSERKFHATYGTLNQKPKEIGEIYTLYSPDNIESAKTRYSQITTFIRDNIQGLYEYEFFNIHIDAIEFQRRYSLDPFKQDNKDFVPLSIINRFQKIHDKETTMNHTVNSVFMAYK